jgi:hypothetical protein
VADRSGPPTRLAGLLTDDEQAWLSGAGDRPSSLSERLPERAPVLVPRAGRGDWLRVVRGERVLVADGALVRRTGGRGRRLAERGQVRSATWLVDDAALGAGLPPDQVGWLVLQGDAGVVVALALQDWDAGAGGLAASTDQLRRTGAEALAVALGLALQTVSDRGVAARQIGRIPADPVLKLTARRPRAFALCCALAVVGGALGVTLPGTHALVWVPWLLLAGAGATVVRRTVLLRAVGRVGWTTPPYRGPGGRALGPVGEEIAVTDGTGWEARLPGPSLGGVGAVVVARDADGTAWALQLYDRDEHLLLRLPAGPWGVTADDLSPLRAALGPSGVAVTGSQVDPPRPAGGLPGADAADRTDHSPPAAATSRAGGPAQLPWRAPPERIVGPFLLVLSVVVGVGAVAAQDLLALTVTGVAAAGLLAARQVGRRLVR